MQLHIKSYTEKLTQALCLDAMQQVPLLGLALQEAWQARQCIYFCGNGGSAGNAIHLANDYLYGISRVTGHALRVHALPANSAVLTCLANDEGYEHIFAHQLAVLAQPGDVALAFSGSGNSPNILRALETCKSRGVRSFAVLGYSGGKAKALADVPIHVAIDDMQISEDLQLVVGHMLMQWLYERRDQVK